VCDGGGACATGVVDEMDRAPVRSAARDQGAQLVERPLDVERRPEERARLGQEAQAVASP
jgi:hypothetical protein